MIFSFLIKLLFYYYLYLYFLVTADMYKDMIKSGMQDFEKYTCIRFVPRTIQPDYINFDFKGQ